jgi:cellulose synthase/poly-beta-1,6-N-acetylglucosamine synthase-like glycosyltransferase
LRIVSLVPVAPTEPLYVIEKSYKSLKALETNGFTHSVYYIIDVDGSETNDKKLNELMAKGVKIISRKPRGKRAGAINDALDNIGECDYIAIFDVDSRPEKNFLKACLRAMEGENVFIVSSPRAVSNGSEKWLTRIVALEYEVIGYLYKKFSGGFLQFNGLIGLIRFDLLKKFRLNEERICEDVDFTTRMYLQGYRAELTSETLIREQAPVNIFDLISQRVRWYSGALEAIRYCWKFFKGPMPIRTKIQWIAAMVLPFIIIVFFPLNLLSPILTFKKTRKLGEALKLTCGLAIHTIILQVSALVAIFNLVSGKKIVWKPPERSKA